MPVVDGRMEWDSSEWICQSDESTARVRHLDCRDVRLFPALESIRLITRGLSVPLRDGVKDGSVRHVVTPHISAELYCRAAGTIRCSLEQNPVSQHETGVCAGRRLLVS